MTATPNPSPAGEEGIRYPEGMQDEQTRNLQIIGVIGGDGGVQAGASSAGATPFSWAALLTASLSPAACAANTTAEQIFNPAGFANLQVGDIVTVNKPTAQAGLGIVGARVSSAGHLAITFSNNTGSPITPTASETYSVIAFRP